MTAQTNKAPFAIPDVKNATIYLLNASHEGQSAIAVSFSPAQLPDFPETNVTERAGVDLARALTDLRAVALAHIDLIIDQFEGTEKFLPQLYRAVELSESVLSREDVRNIAQVVVAQLVRDASDASDAAEGQP